MALPEPNGHWAEMKPIIWPPDSDNVAARVFQHKLTPLLVLRSVAKLVKDTRWIHVSVSRPDRLPSWPELTKVKDELMGDVHAVHQIPRKQDYVNVHPYCLHIWAPISVGVIMPNLQEILHEEGA